MAVVVGESSLPWRAYSQASYHPDGVAGEVLAQMKCEWFKPWMSAKYLCCANREERSVKRSNRARSIMERAVRLLGHLSIFVAKVGA